MTGTEKHLEYTKKYIITRFAAKRGVFHFAQSYVYAHTKYVKHKRCFEVNVSMSSKLTPWYGQYEA